MTDRQAATEQFVKNAQNATINGLCEELSLSTDNPARRGALDIAIPIYNNAPLVDDCLTALLPTLSQGDQVWLLDDASTDSDVSPVIRRFVRQWSATTVIRNTTNLGFVGTANIAFEQTSRDLVLLNSDTRVCPNWLEFLQDALHGNSRAGIVCPVSDNASLLSVVPTDDTPAIKRVSKVSAGSPPLPTAVGFCMLIRRNLIDEVGVFDLDYAPGYGEENDWSMRALKLGFDVVVADRACVLHQGRGSFESSESKSLQARHQGILDHRWPEYRQLVQAWWRDNPLREKTEKLARPEDDREAVVHVLHRQYHVGGTERITRDLIRTLSTQYWNTLVYPGETNNPWCDFELRSTELCRELMLNRRWISPSTRIAGHAADLSNHHSEQALAKVIRGSASEIVHFHHLLHWDSLLLPSLARRLGARVVISVHDFYFVCPIHNQIEYSRGQPCGRRYSQDDGRCIACLGGYSSSDQMPAGVGTYAESRHAVIGHMLSQADAITVPSHFMRSKILQAFDLPDHNRLHIIAHGTEVPGSVPAPPGGENLVLGYFGGDQVLKGASLVVELARKLVDKPVQIRIYGRVKAFDPSTLPENIVLCGFYNPVDVGRAMAEIDVCLMPSHYEESFSLIVSESWAHGVPVISSDRGALRERIIDGVNGWLPRNLDADSWADTVTRLLDSQFINQVRQRLGNTRVQSIEDTGKAYADLYKKIMAEPRDQPEPLSADPQTRKSSFELLLRRFRSRHIRGDASWYGRDVGQAGTGEQQCLGIMRDHWATAQYRIRFPLQALSNAGLCKESSFHIVRESGFSVLDSIEKSGARHVLVQPFLSDEGLSMMESLARQPDLRVVLVVDDLWTALPDDNPVRSLMPVDITDRLTYVASLSHSVVVTTTSLAQRIGLQHPGLTVINNALPASIWDRTELRPPRVTGGRPRIGWAGAPQHQADLAFLEPVIRETSKLADWVFMGMCPDNLRPWVSEFRAMSPFSEYPDALGKASLDIGIAPLAHSEFNRCKSHLKILEYGILGIPVIASKLEPYHQAPVTLLEKNDTRSWIDSIQSLVRKPEERHQQGRDLRNWVLKNHMQDHRNELWQSILGLENHAE